MLDGKWITLLRLIFLVELFKLYNKDTFKNLEIFQNLFVYYKLDIVHPFIYTYMNVWRLVSVLCFIIFQSSMIEDSEGPLFRISLITEKYDDTDNCNKEKNIDFVCTCQELQDLLYKLKDALRHCNNVTNKIN